MTLESGLAAVDSRHAGRRDRIESLFDFFDPVERERLTCYRCGKRRIIRRWYVAGIFNPCFPACSECKDLLPREGDDFTIDEDDAEPMTKDEARAIMDAFNPGSGALVDLAP